MADGFFNTLGGLLSDAIVKAGLIGHDFVNDRNQMPSSQRIYLDTFLDKNKNTITEKDFHPSELSALMDIIKAKQSLNPKEQNGYITYKDYAQFVPKEELSANAGIRSGEKNPYENIRTTLGQFRYQVSPTDNYVFINDKYDFNKVPEYSQDETGDYLGKDISKGRMLRSYGVRNMPEGTGRNVTIQMPGLLGK